MAKIIVGMKNNTHHPMASQNPFYSIDMCSKVAMERSHLLFHPQHFHTHHSKDYCRLHRVVDICRFVSPAKTVVGVMLLSPYTLTTHIVYCPASVTVCISYYTV